jgi:alpha-beta hydrolase superfamily lysophospholipase
MLTLGVNFSAQRNPLTPMPIVDQGFYTRTVSRSGEGLWAYNMQWRPERGFLVRPGWLASIFAGQARVERGLNISVPVLVLMSNRSMLQATWNEDMTRSDVALNVDVIAHSALSLGNYITIAKIEDALHDVFLSAAKVREHAYNVLEHWLLGMVSRPPTHRSATEQVHTNY